MKITLTILLIFLFNVGTNINDADWVLEMDKNEIMIWTRETGSSRVKSFKAITTLTASVEQLATVLNDVEAYPEWMSDVEYTEVLEEISENERFYYFEVNAPWPVSNRDNIVHFILKKDPKTMGFKVTVIGEASYIPQKPDIVRIPESKGSWEFIPLENGGSKVIFEYAADPGGKLPTWAINMFIVDGPFKTLSNLKEFVKQNKYQK